MADEIAYNIGSLPPLPSGALLDTDLMEVERPGGAPGTPNDNYRMSAAQLRAALAVDPARTGDTLVSARDPGAGWLRQDTVYSQSAYPALYGLVGLIGDSPPGRIWASQVPTAGISAPISCACWVTDSTAVAVGNNAVWRTTDAGVTWTLIPVVGNLTEVARVTSSIVIAVGAPGVILRSTDGGASWSAISSGTTQTLSAITVFSSTRVHIVGASNTGRVSDNAGASFTSSSVPLSAGSRTIRFSSSVAVIFPSGGTSAARTVDSGATWTTFTIPSVSNTRDGLAFDGSRGFFVTNAGVVYRTVDAGITWTTSTLAGVIQIVRGCAITGQGCGVIVASTGTSYCTFDYGETWLAISLALTGAVCTFAVSGSLVVGVGFSAGTGAQFRSLAEYSFDPGTQFKTPAISGLGEGINGYIKA